ncbi:hypothetical protein PGT21_011020 [Puccinia graminis f. sp. tritici]|uniref:Uncharacterized protein n=1 Tax=Puccinia graminis f. sp. tritici TaxID=56615 RepID=A0A5B0LT22_PUCGR|nr:hypothetical protein PGT21_011020 [Puccinia graminis f. sp. tritici]KAA1092155.1 hypothetical protein PGTUg99_009689 [Puccinia graminis f. sp. tritici]
MREPQTKELVNEVISRLVKGISASNARAFVVHYPHHTKLTNLAFFCLKLNAEVIDSTTLITSFHLPFSNPPSSSRDRGFYMWLRRAMYLRSNKR